MTYRKIEVNGKTYEYVIGKTNTKIKNVGIFINKNIQEWFDHSPQCSCGPEYNCYEGEGPMGYAVTPSAIKRLILQHAL